MRDLIPLLFLLGLLCCDTGVDKNGDDRRTTTDQGTVQETDPQADTIRQDKTATAPDTTRY